MTPRGFALSAALAALCLASAAPASAETTADQTLGDRNQDNRIDVARGESTVLRTDLATAKGGRKARRETLVTFGQFTDTHVVDEESPLRVEFLDAFGPPVNGAYRAQEGMSPHVVNEMIRQMRDAVSPATGRPVDLVMTTGDNSDNSQLNEVRMFIDLMDGRRSVDPDSGTPDTCGLAARRFRYDGVRGGDYYEPDGGPDGAGYASNTAKNMADVGRSNRLRDFPGLYEAMNAPFPAVGLGVPWYGIFGNHDALVQGNQPRNEALAALAVGCVKVTALSPLALTNVTALLAQGLNEERLAEVLRLVTNDMLATAANPLSLGLLAKIVPSDQDRRPLKKSEYIEAHFRTSGEPRGHGFTRANVESGMGNYSFSPKPGVRFIVLDTINENGFSDGNIDDEQFKWLHAELSKADAAREVAVAFAHHTLRTMNQPAVSPFPPGDIGGNPSLLVHFGLGANGETAACPTTDPLAETTLGETTRCLFLRHKSLIAFVNGHEHLNRVTPFSGADGAGFWEITSASHIDWPQQSRLIDLADNKDGTLSIFTTMLDHKGPALPTVVPQRPIDAAGVEALAAISRELSFNDPQGDNGEEGRVDARGTAADRNAELVIRNPHD